MSAITIGVMIDIEVPDNRPLDDYIRAAVNHLHDVLPQQKSDTSHKWSAGVGVHLVVKTTAQVAEFERTDRTVLVQSGGRFIDVSDL